jgi:hypothetical protein
VEERVAERTRIARDLHDTLVQSFQGVVLKFGAITYLLENHPEARKRLEGVCDEARKAIGEGRDAVQGLRSSTVIANDLARAITTLGEALATEPSSDQAGQTCPEFRRHVEGKSRFVNRGVIAIAKAILFLCSDDASYITGSTLTPDGGFTLTL